MLLLLLLLLLSAYRLHALLVPLLSDLVVCCNISYCVDGERPVIVVVFRKLAARTNYVSLEAGW